MDMDMLTDIGIGVLRAVSVIFISNMTTIYTIQTPRSRPLQPVPNPGIIPSARSIRV